MSLIDLFQEFVSEKKKLQTAKQKRETLFTEVRYDLCFAYFSTNCENRGVQLHRLSCVSPLKFRFLRRRQAYLLKMQSSKPETEHVQHQNSNVQPEIAAKEWYYDNVNVNEAVRSSHTGVSEMKSILVTVQTRLTI